MENNLKEFNINEFNVGQNLYIDASAGTGKTYTIQQLTAKMVEEGIPLEKILIVTYTDKAAGELRDRIRQKLEECAAKSTNDCFKAALQNINDAPVFTIHSFCKNTLDTFAYDANAAMEMGIEDDSKIINLIDKLIRDEWAYNPEFQRIINKADFDFEVFRKNCAQAVLLYNRADNITLNILKSSLNNSKELCENIPEFKENLNVLLSVNDTKITKDKVYKETLSRIENWNDSEVFFNRWGDAKKSSIIELLKDQKNSERYIEAVNYFFSLKGKLPECFFQTESQLFILENLKNIYDKWEQYKKDNKLQSYDNMIRAVHDEVCNSDNSILLQKLRKTYKYAIIDEFQDTNQRQWDIFKKVFLDNSSGEDQNNIIVVGDPKQSIYAFQGADLYVYREAIKEIGIENGRKLSVNNRSSDVLIKACNLLFSENFFDNKDDFSDSECPPVERKKLPAELNGNITQPLWISDELTAVDFCKYAVNKILECCKIDENGKTALQVYDKSNKKLRNVRFSDFAVLGRTRSELVYMEVAMQAVGIPYTRYKDTNLFSGIEAFHWISLLKAIAATDFAGYNRKYLNCALISDFFRLDFAEVNKDIYSDPTKSPMKEILNWRMLASKKRWSELQECIYSDTEIDKYLNVPNKLQSLAKLRQIGSYIFDYLYNHKTSLETAIKHLEGLSIASEDVDETDGNLIAKGCDFQTVKVMTIHASKGLAFPIVIAIGGLKGFWSSMPGPFLYRNSNGKCLSFDDLAKAHRQAEDYQEYRRLMYVAYTRAESLMILPRYKHERTPGGFDFLISALKRMVESDYKDKSSIIRLDEPFNPDYWKSEDIQIEFKKILEEIRDVKDFCKNDEELKKQISNLQSNLNQLKIWIYSYSSISKKKKSIENLDAEENFDEEVSLLEGRFDKEEADIDKEKDTSNIKSFDVDPDNSIVRVCCKYVPEGIEKLSDYPRGSKLGNAIHSIFEKIDFNKFGDLPAAKVAEKNVTGRGTVEEAFENQSLPVRKNQEWIPYTAKMVWNTLNADLPEIRGNLATKATFALKDLAEENKKAEMEFHLDVRNMDWVNRFCKGYMDLIFVRKDKDGTDYYSILDWKSDVLDDTAYSSGDALTEKVDDDYSVQRVLYSYCLIKWLKQFYSDMSYEDIFNKHFGGIYYVFIRGCKAKTSNGIYAQTWKSFAALEKSYKNIIRLMEA